TGTLWELGRATRGFRRSWGKSGNIAMASRPTTAPSSPHSAARSRQRSHREPGGLEGILQIATVFKANDSALAERPDVRFLFLDLLEFAPVAAPSRVEADGGDDGIAAVEQLLNLVLVRVERLPRASQGEHHLPAAMPTAGIDFVGRIHVFDL